MPYVLPEDNYESQLTQPAGANDTELFVNSLPTATAGVYTVFEEDGVTVREIGYFTGTSTGPNKLTGRVPRLRFAPSGGVYLFTTDATQDELDHPVRSRIAICASVYQAGLALAVLNGDMVTGGVLKYPTSRTISDARHIPDKEYVDAAAAAAGGITAFLVTDNGGVTINVGAGILMAGSKAVTYAGASAQALTDNATNYVQINGLGSLLINTTGFVEGYIPLATVITLSGDITSLADKRAWLTVGAKLFWLTTTSSGTDTFTATSNPTLSALVDGMMFMFKPDIDNAGVATLNIDGIGAVSLNFSGSSTLYNGTLKANVWHLLVYSSASTTFGVQRAGLNQKSIGGMENCVTLTSSGTDAYAGTISPALYPAAYTYGLELAFIPDVDNTGACSFNLAGLGAKSLKTPNGSDPVNGYVKTNCLTKIFYDGTNFIITSTPPLLIGVTTDASVLHRHTDLNGSWDGSTYSAGTAYLAPASGFVQVLVTVATNQTGSASLLTDAANPPTVERAFEAVSNTNSNKTFISCPVKKGEYFKVVVAGSASVSIYFLPNG